MSRIGDTYRILDIVAPYCDRIRRGGKHFVCYPKGLKRTITISASPSDGNRESAVFREFRRNGIIIKELKK